MNEKEKEERHVLTTSPLKHKVKQSTSTRRIENYNAGKLVNALQDFVASSTGNKTKILLMNNTLWHLHMVKIH